MTDIDPKLAADRAQRLQWALLRRIDQLGGDVSFFSYTMSPLAASIMSRANLDWHPTHLELIEATWSLVAASLVFVDFTKDRTNPQHWTVHRTLRGREAVAAGDASPYDPQGYLARLRRLAPGIGRTAYRYVDEALRSFNEGIYLGATILLGVASEAAFLELSLAFLGVLNATEQDNFRKVLSGPMMFSGKFDEFRKRLVVRKNDLPEEFQDGMALTLDAVADMLRRNRNDAGHPTGKPVDKDDCFIALQMTIAYLAKLYRLKEHFEQVPRGNGP